ncbi:isochorismatase family protein [Streptomyces cadmiisoli]|uniref:isochorismatase family protein n=1 Tax=Streptomyces cadmiisoli TaxID=2184053 RepID=UPI00365682B7
MHSPNAGPHDALTPENAVVLLVDHQLGLMQLIDDMSPETAKNNVLGLARATRTLGLPVLLTTNRDEGPNGPLLPELADLFHDSEVIRRPGVVNAYRWPALREALEATGRKKVVVAGVTDATCLIASVDLVQDGYEVHAVIDASGAVASGQTVRETVVANLSQAGVNIKTWFGVVAELIAARHRDETQGRRVASEALHDHLPGGDRLLDTGMAHVTGRTVVPAWFEDGESEPTGRTQALGPQK